MKINIQSKWYPVLGALGTALFLFLLAKPIFRDYFSNPNGHMYAISGDALMLYYNNAYHTRFDHGSQLRSMNYPDGEYIYLTDAQGSVSNVMQWINQNIADISMQTVGWVNAINLYLLFAAVILIFFILRALKTHFFTAILFAPLILLLSPQIWRMGGHFGLAYPFLIPMGMLWFLRKYSVGFLEKRDALVFSISLFFTYNNPYTGANLNFFLLFAGAMLFAFEGFKWKNWKRPAIISGMGLLPLLIVFLDFKLFDQVHDRLNPQWGFFVYHATFEGFFHPPGSILFDLLTQNKIMVPAIEFEAFLNVGIVATLAVVCLLLISLVARFYRKNKPVLQVLSTEHRVLIFSALLLFLIAANTSLINISQEWIEANFGWLLMFKASGRLGWTLYFALSITAAVFVDRLFRITSPWYMAALFSILIAALWNSEINQYTLPKFRNVFNGNIFSKEEEQNLLKVLNQNKVNLNEFQAILCLPKMIAWSDKILSDLNFRTQVYSTRLSLATGLPMVNSMLSRIGLQHTLERVQMHANPLIERTLVQKFPNQKDLLVIIGSDAIPELKGGEKYLERNAEKLVETADYSIYRLKLVDINNNAVIQKARDEVKDGKDVKPSLHLGFDDQTSPVSFFGPGSLETKPGENFISEFVSPFEQDTQMVVSAWTYLDPGKWSAGFWLVSVLDSSGKEIQFEKMETRKSTDVQGTWLRTSGTVFLPKNARLRISTFSEKPMIVDELMLWPVGVSPIVRRSDTPEVLYENFKLKY